MIWRILIVVCLFWCSQAFKTHHSGPSVRTKSFIFTGYRDKVLGRNIDVFLGIPYAKPPIGELRFKKTVKLDYDPENREPTVYHADKFGPACAQNAYHKHNYTYQSEDCLYLNIWSPSGSINQHKPVFFYIYGSGWMDGSVTEVLHRGDVLAALGDMIVVTVNYRLGFFGFGYGGNEEMPGNMGNYDVLEALEWVHENIAHFGGDRNHVTLAGGCSGAMTASGLLLSPLVSPKLFDKVYLISSIASANIGLDSTDLALKKAMAIAKAAGCEGSDDDASQLTVDQIECLRGLNASDILRGQDIPEVLALTPSPNAPQIQATFGDDLIPEAPDVMIAKGWPKRKDVLLLIGNEENEDEISQNYVPTSKTDAYEYLNEFITNSSQLKDSGNLSEAIFDQIFDHYFGPVRDGDRFHLKAAMSSFIGDYFHYCPQLLGAEGWARHGQVVHAYVNKYVMDGLGRRERPYGTYHGDDAFQIFGQPFHEYEKFSDRDRHVTRKLIQVIGDFVRGYKLKWPPMLTRRDHILPLRWIITAQMDPRLVRVDPKDKICHYWGKLGGSMLVNHTNRET